MIRLYIRIKNLIINTLVIIYAIFEGIFFDLLINPIINFFKNLKIVKKLEEYLSHRSRYVSLAIFIIPFILMEVFGLASLQLFAKKYITSGIALHLLKYALTIPVSVVFRIARKKLVSFYIIRKGYGILLYIQRTKPYKTVKKFKNEMKEKIKNIKNSIIYREVNQSAASFIKANEIGITVKYIWPRQENEIEIPYKDIQGYNGYDPKNHILNIKIVKHRFWKNRYKYQILILNK